MAQSTTTVTPPNPTPPTNMGTGIANAGPTTPPPNTAFVDAVYGTITPGGDPWHPGKSPNTVPPYLDDGTAATALAFAAPNSGAAAEGAGSEVVVTQTYAASVLVPGSAATYLPTGQTPAWAAGDPGGPVRTFSDLGSYVGGSTSINESHASKVAGTPTISALSQQNTASGAGNVSQAVTGTGFNRTSVIYVNGIEQTTTYTSATSITAATVAKKLTAGTWPVVVINGDTRRQSASFTWTFT